MLSLLLAFCAFGQLPNTVPAQSSERVKLSVYYESLCPDSDHFFHQQLKTTYQKLSDNLDVEIVPYGNAHYSGQPGSYKFRCQHGPEECYGNMVQSCYITLVNNTADQIKLINCAFETYVQTKTLDRCIKDVDLRRQVKKCVTSTMGNNILYQMAKKTDSLVPPHTFIPWITINGEGGQDLNDKAIKHLMSAVCDKFTDEKPTECKESEQNEYRKFRNNYL